MTQPNPSDKYEGKDSKLWYDDQGNQHSEAKDESDYGTMVKEALKMGGKIQNSPLDKTVGL